MPVALRRFLVDEIIPGASITVVPDLKISDFEQLLENPTKETLDYWIAKGERSIWPAVELIRVRCEIEFTLDRLYVLVRSNPSEMENTATKGALEGSKKVRQSDRMEPIDRRRSE